MELYYVQWAFRPAGTTLVPGERLFNDVFFAHLEDATTLFEKIKEDPPCEYSINLTLHRVTIPERKERLIQFLSNLSDFNPKWRGFKFDDEDHEKLDEHLGFDFNCGDNSW